MFRVKSLHTLNLENPFTGALTPFGAGYHFRYPWEVVRNDHLTKIEEIDLVIKENFPTKDRGFKVEAKFSVRYVVSVPYLPQRLKTSKQAIEEEIKARITGYFRQKISKLTPDEILDDLRDEMCRSHLLDDTKETLGVEVVSFRLSDMDMDSEYMSIQKKLTTTRLAQEEIKKIFTNRSVGLTDPEELKLLREEISQEVLTAFGLINAQTFNTRGGGRGPTPLVGA